MKPYLKPWPRAFVGPLAVLTAVVLAAPPGTTAEAKPPAPQPPIRFGVEVGFVEVYAVVTDRRGRFVSSLRPEDFEVFEDGKPQEISSFNLVDVPIERRDPVLFSGPPEPGVRSNTQVSEGRVFVLVLDDLHTAPEQSQRVTRAVHELIDHMGADDIALVAHAGGKGRPYQFTSDKHSLRRAAEGFTGRALRPAALTILEESQWTSFRNRPDSRPSKSSAGDSASSGSRGQEAGRGIWDPYEAERVQRASAALHVVEGLAKLLTEVPRRRKAIVYFGEGISYNIHPRTPGDRGLRGGPAPGRDTVRDSMRQAIRAANRANVAVYAIDPRGLGGSTGDPSASVSVYTGAPVPIGAPSIQSALQSELAFGQESLRGLAEETGGFAFLNRNDLTRSLDRVVEESSHYYLLGYRSTNPRQDGRYRKIGVRVRVRDLEVRARKGYFAPDEGVERRQPAEDLKGASPELARLIQGPLPVPGIPMRAIASVLRVGDDRAVVPLVVELDIAGFVFEESEGRLHDAVEFSALATDRRGRVQGSVHSEVQLAVRPETHQLLKRAGFRFLTSLELPSGQHRIRIAAIESRTKRGGSVFYDVEIPDYGQSALVMTPLVVTSASEALIPVIGEEEDRRKAILLPTTRRRFSQSDRLIVLAKVYPRHSPGSMLPVIEIVTEVEDMDQKVVFRRMQERGGTELIAPRDGITQEMEVSLSEWAPGEYQVQMTARSFARGAGDDVSRRALIEIY